MKTLFLLGVTLLSSSAFAATCPSGSTQVYSCRSTPVRGDYEVASGILDSIAVCQQGQRTILALQKDRDQDVARNVRVSQRPGGNSYAFSTGNLAVELSVATGISPRYRNAIHASLTLRIAGQTPSSTYTCAR